MEFELWIFIFKSSLVFATKMYSFVQPNTVFVICTNIRQHFRDQFIFRRSKLTKIRRKRNEANGNVNRNFSIINFTSRCLYWNKLATFGRPAELLYFHKDMGVHFERSRNWANLSTFDRMLVRSFVCHCTPKWLLSKFCGTFAIADFLTMSHIGLSIVCKFTSVWARNELFFPPSNNVTAIPDDATASAIWLCARIEAKIF